jgi:hypothetical protein
MQELEDLRAKYQETCSALSKRDEELLASQASHKVILSFFILALYD